MAHAHHEPGGSGAHERRPGLPGSESPGHGAHASHGAGFARRFWVSLALTVPVIALSPMPLGLIGMAHLAFPGDRWALLLLATVIYGYGGVPFFTGMRDELGARRPGMMTLVTVGITTSYAYSVAVAFGMRGEPLYWELATLVDVMLLGHWIEMRSTMAATGALEAIARLLPADAHLLDETGAVRDIPLDEVGVGQRVLVRSSERVPADGGVVRGSSTVDESLLTGESTPVHKTVGDTVVGGSMNGSGSLELEVTRVGSETFLAQVMRVVAEAQASKSHTQRLADSAAFGLTLLALGAGALTFGVWLLFTSAPLSFVLERVVAVVVIACPHALGLAIPLVVAVTTALAARSGVLIRDNVAFETARRIDAVVFDKTGTLTEGRFGVVGSVALEPWTEAGLIEVAAAVERGSEHPVAAAIVDAATGSRTAEGFEAIPGAGVRARVDGAEVRVLSAARARADLGDLPEPITALAARSFTTVAVVVDGVPVGAITVGDVGRPESKEAIDRLRRLGIRTIMLTGDSRAVAERVAAELGIDEVHAEVLPAEKAAAVERLRAGGHVVAMVGDGVNDAPALAQADVGIAIGAGTDIATETADVVLVRSDPRAVASIVELARRSYRKMFQNLLWATGYNIVALPLAAGVLASRGVLLSPAVGAALMAASTVIVSLNARTLGRARDTATSGAEAVGDRR